MLKLIVISLAVVVLGGVAYGSYHLYQAPDYAKVVAVEPVIKHWIEPKQVCHQVAVKHQRPVKDKHQVAGSTIGAVIGGVIGHQFGSGHGKEAATVAGAIIGGITGNKVQENIQEGRTYTTTEQRCRSVQQPHSRKDGYKVTYLYEGNKQTIHLAHKPGDQLLVEDGKVVVE